MGFVFFVFSVVLFAWAVLGLISPSTAHIPRRIYSVPIWGVSVLNLFIGMALDEPPPLMQQAPPAAEREFEPALERANERANFLRLAGCLDSGGVLTDCIELAGTSTPAADTLIRLTSEGQLGPDAFAELREAVIEDARKRGLGEID